MTDDLKVLLPKIRKAVPSLIAEEIVGVQPMADDIITNMLKMKVQTPEERAEEIKNRKVGELIHQFGVGWLRWDGTEYIPDHVYMDLKIKGLL